MVNLNRKNFKKGTALIKENDLSRKLFILRSGKVVVYKNHMGGKINLAVLGPGEIFGELSFFDAKKRSASVQALTDVSVDCIDGNSLVDEIEELPTWIHLIFKSVAERFRKVDEKMTVMQSVVDFQNKSFSADTMAMDIYSELLRFIKIVKMMINNSENSFDKNTIVGEIGQVTGKSIVSPKGFIRSLFDNEFFDHDHYHLKNRFEFIEKDLDKFNQFLQDQFDSNDCPILSNEAIAVLKRIISSLDMMAISCGNDDVVISSEYLPGKDETNLLRGYSELMKMGILTNKEGSIFVKADSLIYEFRFHMIVKAFDQSSIYKD
jgi:hypothetical protein